MKSPIASQPVVRIGKFQVRYRGLSGPWKTKYYFRLLAANNEIIAQSEAYTRKASRDKTVSLLLRARMEVV